MTRFHEVQRLPLRRIALALLVPPLAMTALVLWQVALGHPFGKNPLPNSHMIGWTIFLWAVYFRLLMVRIVTEVGDSQLAVALRGLWRSRRVALNDIQSVEPIAFDAPRDFGGYGIRSGNFGTAYIAQGNRGVRIAFADAKPLIISSGRPDELARVLKQSSPPRAKPSRAG